MEPSIDFVAVAMAFGTAVYAALGLDYVTTAAFGLSLQAVYDGSLVIALMIGAYVAIAFFSNKLRSDG